MNQEKVLLLPGSKKNHCYVEITAFEGARCAVSAGFSAIFYTVVLNYLLKVKFREMIFKMK